MERLASIFSTSGRSSLLIFLQHLHFVLVSRYEEYIGMEPDKYGQISILIISVLTGMVFLKNQSWICGQGNLQKLFYDCFPVLFSDAIDTYNSLLTIDTDQPFAYRGKSVLRSIGGIFYDKISDPW